MPFMKGRGALRRTIQYLEKGDIIFRGDVRILSFGFNHTDRSVLYTRLGDRAIKKSDYNTFPRHEGLYNFVFWHLPQLKFKNPQTQMLTFKMMTPTPWIKAYLDDDTQLVIDCDNRSRQEIYNHLKQVLGKSEEVLEQERFAQEAMTRNPANFGYNFERQCMCEMPGQVACPGWEPLPKEMTGKWKVKMKQEAEEAAAS